MRDSETFGIEDGYGDRVIRWLNDAAAEGGLKFEARKYGYRIRTENFGSFEMFSWIGSVHHARKLVVRAGKRFKIRTLEGGYKTRERTFSVKRTDYAMVRRGDKLIGQLQFEAPRFGGGQWVVRAEERR